MTVLARLRLSRHWPFGESDTRIAWTRRRPPAQLQAVHAAHICLPVRFCRRTARGEYTQCIGTGLLHVHMASACLWQCCQSKWLAHGHGMV